MGEIVFFDCFLKVILSFELEVIYEGEKLRVEGDLIELVLLIKGDVCCGESLFDVF